MSFNIFKNEIKNFSKDELVDLYMKVSKDIHYWNYVRFNEYAVNKLEEGVEDNKITGMQVVQKHLVPLKKKRAILLTKLNQLGWNGKELIL